jgi:hypothetical protein
MAVAVEVAFHGQGATLEKYEKTLTLMGTSPGGKHPDPSCLFHWATESGGGVVVTDVWTTKEAFEKFAADKIGPLGTEAGMPKPQIKFIDVASFLTAGS